MFPLKTYRLKTALILMVIILVPVLILSYNGYSLIGESRIASQDKLIVDRLSIGFSDFDAWFTDCLSRLIMINEGEKDQMAARSQTNPKVVFIDQEIVQKMATINQERFKTFTYLDRPCFVMVAENRKVISLGVENQNGSRFAVRDIPSEEFKGMMNKAVFRHPVGRFFAVDGYVLLKVGKVTEKETAFFGSGPSPILRSQENGQLHALFYEQSVNGNYGLGAVEDYGLYLQDYKVFTNKFWIYTFFMVIVSCFAILLIAAKMELPIKKLQVAVDEILKGNLDAAIDVHKNDDFRDLYMHFNHMVGLNNGQIDKLSSKLEQLKQQNTEMELLNQQLESNLSQMEMINIDLSHADQKIMMLLENVVDLIFRVDVQGKITYINQAFMRDLGLEEPTCLQRDVFGLIQGEKDLKGRLNLEMFLNEELRNVIIRFAKEDGSFSEPYSMNTQRVFEDGQVIAVQSICREQKNVNIIQDKLNRRNRELVFLREINETLSGTADLQGLLDTITSKIDHLIGTAICTIRMLNEDGELILKSVSGQYRHLVRRSDISKYLDPSGQALQEQRIVVIREKEHVSFQFGDELNLLMERIKELVFIPLENEGRQMGVISVGLNRKVSESDIQILDNFACQAAIAIDKASLYDKLKLEYLNTIRALATAVEAKDQYTEGHSSRVSKFSCLIAKYMGIQDEALDEIEIAGLLHDIGKIGIGDAILTKPGKLTNDEFDEIKRHPEIGFKIVEPIGLSESIVNGILYHHKRMDMSGYPDHIRMNEVPISARIIGVADAFDAMTSNRSYTQKKDIFMAMDELKRCKGTQFCPLVVEAFEKILIYNPENIEEIVQRA